jgi:hypothetical protein
LGSSRSRSDYFDILEENQVRLDQRSNWIRSIYMMIFLRT